MSLISETPLQHLAAFNKIAVGMIDHVWVRDALVLIAHSVHNIHVKWRSQSAEAKQSPMSRDIAAERYYTPTVLCAPAMLLSLQHWLTAELGIVHVSGWHWTPSKASSWIARSAIL